MPCPGQLWGYRYRFDPEAPGSMARVRAGQAGADPGSLERGRPVIEETICLIVCWS